MSLSLGAALSLQHCVCVRVCACVCACMCVHACVCCTCVFSSNLWPLDSLTHKALLIWHTYVRTSVPHQSLIARYRVMPVPLVAGALLTRLEWSRMPPTLAAAGEPLPPFSIRGDPHSQDKVKLIVHGGGWVRSSVCVHVCGPVLDVHDVIHAIVQLYIHTSVCCCPAPPPAPPAPPPAPPAPPPAPPAPPSAPPPAPPSFLCVCRWSTSVGGDSGEDGASGGQAAFKGSLQGPHIVTRLVMLHLCYAVF